MKLDAKRILITGAGGFVGSSIMTVMLKADWRVVALDRHFRPSFISRFEEQFPGRITFVVSDTTTLPDIDVDALIHAAATTASPDDLKQAPEVHFRSNMNPLLNVLEWAAERHVTRSLFISSSAVYRRTNPAPVTETMLPEAQGLYAIAKYTMELLVATLRDEYGRDAATIRLSNVYGTGEVAKDSRPRVSLISRMLDEALVTGRLIVYRDDPQRDWTYAEDIGKAALALLSQPSLDYSLYNVASEQMFSPLEIAEAIQSVLPKLVIEVRDGCDPSVLPLLRRGFLSHQRFEEQTGFKDWTPIRDGLKHIIDERVVPEAKA